MRLRGEGHEQLHVLGPQGANAGSQQACNFPQAGACFLLQCPPMRLRACTLASYDPSLLPFSTLPLSPLTSFPSTNSAQARSRLCAA